jgi:GDP/UDP-N,N'-diacetylbacillosamine 2-epimerase (hydrolysing)
VEDDTFDLRIAVSGTHLSQAFGMTVHEIEMDGFPIDCRIPILLEENNTPEVTSRVMARALEGFGAYFENRRPELLIVLGDRFEAFAVCAAAVNSQIPIAHLHGGEATEGVLDECFRHAITKMSYIHFTSTEIYRKRVIQLGEAPDRVFNVGAMGVENALHVKRIPLDQIERDLGFPLSQLPYVVVTYHPITLELGTGDQQIENLLAAMDTRRDLNFLITKSNADMGGQRINERLEVFAFMHKNCCVVNSLGMQRYMSVLASAVCVLGNSSSGIIEVPSFGIPTINIGDRQRGRVQAESVINCLPVKEDILRALEMAQSQEFRARAASAVNPYGDGKTSKRICEIIKNILYAGTIDLKKGFYDI